MPGRKYILKIGYFYDERKISGANLLSELFNAKNVATGTARNKKRGGTKFFWYD